MNITEAIERPRKKTGPKPKYASLVEQIEALSVPVPFSGCWIWVGATLNGYGQLTHLGQHLKAHRASFIAHNPDHATPKLVCHHCDVPECVNPDHLYSGDYRTNRSDMLVRKRWLHPWGLRETCSRGHFYEQAGYRIAPDKSRVCKECQRTQKCIYRAKQKAN